MPYYDYRCDTCGDFTELRPMSQCAEPGDCPHCGASAARVILSAPAFALMEAGRRQAFAINERAAHEPKSTRKDGLHPPGCGCCSKGGAGKSRAVYRADGAKTFPSARPWMISH
ncbi:zinc ribbon domain-containing protein [Rhizobiaceae bacterium BDR2-2]|uniref:Zinc ribbon domain-containing protein n=1 Tax=Ectorhizobium quercum TaxID=2965071 RepID=A0AAE3N2X4_9HYPH|nr:zinc ribbon domain-containing protein [Ectorhizobium quercum]MCX8999883.1 zinc ribbon domain-containing protein [Ectorhizobium quercum]